MHEAKITSACVEYLRRVGVRCWRANTGAAWLKGKGGKMRPVSFGLPGQPDIMGWLRIGGRAVFLGVETKNPDTRGKQSPEQREFQRWLEEDGGVYLLVHSASELHDRLMAILDNASTRAPKAAPVQETAR